MTINQLQRIAIVDDANTNTAYYIQKNDQNNLKGLLWGTAGAAVTVGVLAVTATVIISVPAVMTLFVAANAVNKDKNSIYLELVAPVVVVGSLTAVFLNKKILQATGTCFKNAIYHLGPEYQIVAHKKTN